MQDQVENMQICVEFGNYRKYHTNTICTKFGKDLMEFVKKANLLKLYKTKNHNRQKSVYCCCELKKCLYFNSRDNYA